MTYRKDSHIIFSKIRISKLLLIPLTFIFSLNNLSEKEKKYISLPFFVQNIIKDENSYNSTKFILDYFKRQIIANVIVGNSNQKVSILINTEDLCFEFTSNYDFSNEQNIYKYLPKDSSSLKITKKELKFSDGNIMTLGTDIFNFNNKEYGIQFLLQNETCINNKLIGKLGLIIPLGFSSDDCPNLISKLKFEGKINKYTWSLIFTNSNEGYLIIGEDLFIYDPKKYHDSQYIKVYTNSNMAISFNQIYIYDNDGYAVNLKNSKVYLQINIGIIIGTTEYQNNVDSLFFNILIKEKICQRDKVKFKFEGVEKDYYIYHCDNDKFKGSSYYEIEEYDTYYDFPTLCFSSERLENKFTLVNEDLFKLVNNRNYFLVIFEANEEEVNEWKLGEPFYRKYIFTFDIDSKTVGYYNSKLPYEGGEEKTEKQNDKEKQEGNQINNINVENSSNYLKIFIEVFIIICLLILSFFLGIKIKEGRKKKANELDDDDYFYENKNENKKNNRTIN